jgi:hypothetical protein
VHEQRRYGRLSHWGDIMHATRQALSVLFLSSAVMSCGLPASSEAAPGVISGKVTDTQGRPLEGAKLILDVYNHSDMINNDHSTNSYDGTDKKVITDRTGSYRVRVGPGGWRIHGSVDRAFNGDTFSMPLHPENPKWVPGNEGGVRNFNWKLSGAIPNELGGGFYGATLEVVTTYESGFREESYPNVEVVLEPVGPLIDGSTGRSLTLHPNGEGQMPDVPIGRYRMQARLNGRPIKLRMDDNTSPFAGSVTVNFKSRGDQSWGYCTNCAQVELRR